MSNVVRRCGVPLADAVRGGQHDARRASSGWTTAAPSRRAGAPISSRSSPRRRRVARGVASWVAGVAWPATSAPVSRARGARAGGRVASDALRGRHERAPAHRTRRGRGHRQPSSSSIGDRPDFATVFVTPPHAGALEDVMRTVDEVLHPLVSIGCAAESVLGPHREVEQDAAVTLFAGHVGPLVPRGARRGALRRPATASSCGAGRPRSPSRPRRSCSWAIPTASRPRRSSTGSTTNHPGLRVVGGMASAARGPGGNRLALGTDGPHRRRGGRAARSRRRGRHARVAGLPALRRSPRGDQGRAQHRATSWPGAPPSSRSWPRPATR